MNEEQKQSFAGCEICPVRDMRHSMAAMCVRDRDRRSALKGAHNYIQKSLAVNILRDRILGTRAAVKPAQHLKTRRYRFSDREVQAQRNGMM